MQQELSRRLNLAQLKFLTDFFSFAIGRVAKSPLHGLQPAFIYSTRNFTLFYHNLFFFSCAVYMELHKRNDVAKKKYQISISRWCSRAEEKLISTTEFTKRLDKTEANMMWFIWFISLFSHRECSWAQRTSRFRCWPQETAQHNNGLKHGTESGSCAVSVVFSPAFKSSVADMSTPITS